MMRMDAGRLTGTKFARNPKYPGSISSVRRRNPYDRPHALSAETAAADGSDPAELRLTTSSDVMAIHGATTAAQENIADCNHA